MEQGRYAPLWKRCKPLKRTSRSLLFLPEQSRPCHVRARMQVNRLWNWRWRVHEKCDQVDPSLTSAHKRKSGVLWAQKKE